METEFMGYKVSCHCRPNIKRGHNIRDPKIVHAEKHIDHSGRHEVILDMGTMQECYEQIFGEAVKEYNAKQKRKDRKIANYLAQILSDRRKGNHKNIKADGSRKAAYEMILKIGRADNCPDHEKSCEILKAFCEEIPKKYPNIVPIGIYLHDDEFFIDEETGDRIPSTPHIHFDFVYIAHRGKSVKTGLSIQNSMSGALAEMGFVTGKSKGTAQMQFEESVRHDLQDFAERLGLKIDRTPGERHSHMQKPVYQQKRENEKKEQQLKNQAQQNAKKSVELAHAQNDLERDKELFETSKKKVKECGQIYNEVEANNLSIDSEIDSLRNNRSEDFSSRLNKFVTNVKKIVTAVTTELSWYKSTFRNFWNKGAKDFRQLADIMERNNCKTFFSFNQKLVNGQLDYQLEKKQLINHKHAVRHKQIDNVSNLER